MASPTEILLVDTSEKEEETKLTGRELGMSELMYNIYLYRSGWGLYYHVGVFDSTAEVTDEQFLETFRILVNFQPLLRMKIINASLGSGDNRRQYFEPIPAENALDIRWVNLSRTGEWTELMEKETSVNIDPETGPLWKAIIGRVVKIEKEAWEYVIVFYIHHGIVEAVSCFDLICNQLLPILNKVINGEPPDDTFLKPLPLPPTLENVLFGQKGPTDFCPPWYVRATFSLLRWKIRTFGSARAGDNWRPAVYSQDIPNNTPSCRFSRLLIPADATSDIINECRHHRVGVHSALLTAFSYATAQTMKEFGATPDRLIQHNWPIDLRKFIPELTTPHTLGYFTGGGSSKIKLPESFEFDRDQAWSFATKLNKSVKAMMNRRMVLSFTAKFLTGMVDQLMKSEDHPFKFFGDIGFRMHFTISNLGNCDAVSKLETTSPHFVDMKENYFGIAMNDATYLLKDGGDVDMGPFITTLTFKGCMNIAVGYIDRWMSKEFIEKFLTNAAEILNQMCKSQ